MMEWSPQQREALNDVYHWLKKKNGSRMFRLFGFAGTGKSTLAKEIAANVDGSTIFMAYTGKASLVMRNNGCRGASTIHSFIYRPKEDVNTGKVTFDFHFNEQVAEASLIIVDEVSMVGEDIGRDLLKFGVKILVLGDPFQLPPISGSGFFINDNPNIMLTEIHRQALNSPIIRMSMDIREGRNLINDYGDCKVIDRMELTNDELLKADQVLCGTNRTRKAMNEKIRMLKGMAEFGRPWIPKVGDKLICIKNNHKKGTLNGSLWTIDSIKGNQIYDMGVKSIDGDSDNIVEIKVPVEFFMGKEDEMPWRERKGFDEFTFGYTITVHKGQGSQWDNVVVIDESGAFGENSARHLYTAITRAASKVIVAV